MSCPTHPLNGSALDRLLRAELAQLLDRLAVSPGTGTALAGLDPEARAWTEEAEARLAAARLRLLAGYEEWSRALEACADLWAIAGLRATAMASSTGGASAVASAGTPASTSASTSDRRAA
jgi:hypothetical protein